MTPTRAGHSPGSPLPVACDPSAPIHSPAKSRERWGLVAACAALMAINSGGWYSASVFFVALIQDFGWGYASTAGIFSLSIILYGIWGVPVGYLVDRFGPRRVILAGGLLGVGDPAVFSLSREIPPVDANCCTHLEVSVCRPPQRPLPE